MTKRAGLGRGLSALLPGRGRRSGTGRSIGGRPAGDSRRRDPPEPEATPDRFPPGGSGRAGLFHPRAGCFATRRGAPSHAGRVRAAGRRAPAPRIEAGRGDEGAGHHPACRRSPSSRTGPGGERAARRSRPPRGRPGLPQPRRAVRAHPGRRRAPCRKEPCARHEHAAFARAYPKRSRRSWTKAACKRAMRALCSASRIPIANWLPLNVLWSAA